ncbi:MAG: GerMN domain-containing protein [Acidobacteriota bacterium]
MARPGRVIVWLGLVAVVVGVGSWAAVRVLVRPAQIEPAKQAAPGPVAAPGDRRIKVKLFYVSEDGLRLVSLERDVPFADTTTEQARRIVEAQLVPPPPPLLAALPGGTTLRGIYLAEKSDAYVDFGDTIRTNHPGGSLNELLTVYSIVSVLTVNLPAITSVQILVGGHEVDTLAGHVDLRRPLPRAAQWLEPPPVAAAR